MKLILGDSLVKLRDLPTGTIDAVVCDPPYGLKFMNRLWDYDVPGTVLWREVFRVMKPGAHLLSFGGTRTYHRLAVEIENAGFEIRDMLSWIYGSGFPKSLDVSKAIDKAAGAEREVVGINGTRPVQTGGRINAEASQNGPFEREGNLITAPATDAAKEWKGWGTALKPANEPIVLARKPLSEKTVAANVLRWGTGALNIDGGRIEAADQAKFAKNWDRETICDMRGGNLMASKAGGLPMTQTAPQGRWPANLLLDEVAAEMLDEQSGLLQSRPNKNPRPVGEFTFVNQKDPERERQQYETTKGGASRFFKVVKQTESDIVAQCLVNSVGARQLSTGERSVQGLAPENSQHASADKSQCENTHARTAECFSASTSETPRARKSSAQQSATPNTASESPDLNVKSAASLADFTAIGIAQKLAATRPDLIRELTLGLGSIKDFKSCIQTQGRVLTAVGLESTDIISTTPNFWKSFGSALHAIACTIIETENDTGLGEGQLRFRYQAKASKSERNAGLEGMPLKISGGMSGTLDGTLKTGSGNERNNLNQNSHPTVKPIKLMEYLCKLITPPGGIILDPFLGSGSTLVAAKRLGFQGIGIEMSEEYLEIARRRIEHAVTEKQAQLDLEA